MVAEERLAGNAETELTSARKIGIVGFIEAGIRSGISFFLMVRVADFCRQDVQEASLEIAEGSCEDVDCRT
jgi:hypothetical protein